MRLQDRKAPRILSPLGPLPPLPVDLPLEGKEVLFLGIFHSVVDMGVEDVLPQFLYGLILVELLDLGMVHIPAYPHNLGVCLLHKPEQLRRPSLRAGRGSGRACSPQLSLSRTAPPRGPSPEHLEVLLSCPLSKWMEDNSPYAQDLGPSHEPLRRDTLGVVVGCEDGHPEPFAELPQGGEVPFRLIESSGLSSEKTPVSIAGLKDISPSQETSTGTEPDQSLRAACGPP